MAEPASSNPEDAQAGHGSSPPPHFTAPKSHDAIEQQDFANPTLSIIGTPSRAASLSGVSSTSREGTPPPLPPRPKGATTAAVLKPSTLHATTPARPSLVSKATTQLSFADSSNHQVQSPEPSASRAPKGKSYFGLNLGASRNHSDADDSASIRSSVPTLDAGLDAESMLGDMLGGQASSLFQSFGHRFAEKEAESLFPPDPEMERAFETEFDDIDAMASDGSNEELVLRQWHAKLNHFLILSSAGKPIYSRHGDDQLISNYIGVVQTIISFYQSTQDTLRSFTAGEARFVVVSRGPLNLVAISRLPESDVQLRSQLDALYMQILSTLTLPSMERMFATRANYDLRRPLQGTEALLSALADGFTRGSPTNLLGALECLRLRKSQRQTIHNTLLKTRSENLLYGLIVASGKLVSVVRPKKHSLHPGDLQLIFNMLFEAGSVKAGGGENWIPLCLPGFNNTGYLYMYVSFLNLEHPQEPVQERPTSREDDPDEVAVLLISANKEGFFELRGMRDGLVEQLHRNGSIEAIRRAVRQGRPKCTDIVPGTVLRHFLYKSRGNVQFVMPSYEPNFGTLWERRRLHTLYSTLHALLHPPSQKSSSSAASSSPLKIHHSTSPHHISLAWQTPLFELYAIAPGTTSRQALAAAAMGVLGWVRREEERVFIIGGAVF